MKLCRPSLLHTNRTLTCIPSLSLSYSVHMALSNPPTLFTSFPFTCLLTPCPADTEKFFKPVVFALTLVEAVLSLSRIGFGQWYSATDVGSWLTGVGVGVEGWVGAGIRDGNGVDREHGLRIGESEHGSHAVAAIELEGSGKGKGSLNSVLYSAFISGHLYYIACPLYDIL